MELEDKEVLVYCDTIKSEILAKIPYVVGYARYCKPRLCFMRHFDIFERFVYLLDGLEAPVKDDWGLAADLTISIKDFPENWYADLQRDFARRDQYVGDFKVGICREPEIDDPEEVARHVELRNFFSLEDGINCCYSVSINERKFNFMNVPDIHDLLDMYIAISQMDVVVTCENTLAYHLSTWMDKPTLVYCRPGITGKGEFFPCTEGRDWRKAIADVKARIVEMRERHDP